MTHDIMGLHFRYVADEPLTDEELKYIADYGERYKIVKYLIEDKVAGLKQFEFTPGERFMDIPVIDMVNEILELGFDGVDEESTPEFPLTPPG